MKKYKHLIFDLDNTLLDFDDAELQAFKRVFKEYEIPETHDSFALYKRINGKLWSDLENGIITRDEIFTNRFALFFNEYGLHVNGKKAEDLYRRFLNDGCKTIKNAEILLNKLKKKEYKIYAGTNGMGITQRKRLANSNLLAYFDDLFISEEIGFEKPDTNFFDSIFHTLNIKDRDSFLMIGDSLSSDILGAQNAHIDSVFFSPVRNKNLSNATYTVTELLQIYFLLEE